MDTLGLLLGVNVTPATTPEHAGAQALLARVLPWSAWLRLWWIAGGYTGTAFAAWVHGLRPKLAVTVVERTFGWLMRHRRFVRDHETSKASAEAFVLLAMIRIQIRRLA